MDLKGILAISGKPGLFKLISQGKNNIIVESLTDGKKMPVYQAHQISALEEISIYTYTGDVPLVDVFKSIYEQTEGQKALSHKSSAAELSAFFKKVLPEYDEDRVYISDIKKVVQWYNLLFDQNMVEFAEEETGDEVEKEDAPAGNDEEKPQE